MSPSSPSKRKADATKNGHPQKKLKKSEVAKEQTDFKGKGRDRGFRVVSADMTVSVAPVFAGNPRAGVEELLDSLVMRYIPALQGVVLAHSNLRFTSERGTVKYDCPFIVCNIRFDATIWNPRMGMKLKGRINLSSPDHISLLVHRTFNISIPRHHIPSDVWEFEYGPAENDPEFGGNDQEEEKGGDGAEEKPEGTLEETDSGSGRWVNRSTGERLGGSSAVVEFTVIGLTVANEMLSLLGSIQDDPFSPAHQPYSSPKKPKKVVPVQNQPDEGEQDDVDSEDEDTFQLLKRKAEAAEEPKEEPESAQKPSKKKRKSKKEKA